MEYNDRLIYSTVTQKDYEETNTNMYDTEGFSHHLMTVSSVQLSVIFSETKKGVKISFRSNGEIYVNELAKEFGGGGHMNAAGASIDGTSMGDISKEVIAKAKNYLK